MRLRSQTRSWRLSWICWRAGCTLPSLRLHPRHPLTTRFLTPFAVFRHRPDLSRKAQRSRSKHGGPAPSREYRTLIGCRHTDRLQKATGSRRPIPERFLTPRLMRHVGSALRTRGAQVLIARSYPDSFPGLRTSVIRTAHVQAVEL